MPHKLGTRHPVNLICCLSGSWKYFPFCAMVHMLYIWLLGFKLFIFFFVSRYFLSESVCIFVSGIYYLLLQQNEIVNIITGTICNDCCCCAATADQMSWAFFFLWFYFRSKSKNSHACLVTGWNVLFINIRHYECFVWFLYFITCLFMQICVCGMYNFMWIIFEIWLVFFLWVSYSANAVCTVR